MNQMQFLEVAIDKKLEQMTIVVSYDDANCLMTFLSATEQYPNVMGTFEKFFELDQIFFNQTGCYLNEDSCLVHIGMKAFCEVVEFSVLIRGKNEVIKIIDGVM